MMDFAAGFRILVVHLGAMLKSYGLEVWQLK